jgi:sulfur carrier protein
MNLWINGKNEALPHGLDLQQLIELKKLLPERIVVELNETIVARESYPTTALTEGDRVEIVSFVGGG